MTDNGADTSAFSLANDIQHEPTSTDYGRLPNFAAIGEVDEMVGPAIYPPLLGNMEFFGYIKDKNDICYPRNIGRSVSIHDEVYFIFGNTVCKDVAGNRIGTTSNTIAYVDDRTKFLESEYKEIFDNGMVKDFVPLNQEEIFIQENFPGGARVVFGVFGGAVDIGEVGVVLYQASIEYANGVVNYVGVARALLTTYADGRIVVDRRPELVFGPDEPRIGSLSSLYYKRYVYFWSHRGDGQIILARVPCLWTGERSQYTYWSGSAWTPTWQDAQPILHDVRHGAVIHTELFGKDKPFVFVGVNQQGDSMVQIGAAADVQGPFDLTPICEALSVDHDSNPRDCIYPHLFASDIPKRELMVTWSEHSPGGGVIAAKLKFKIDEVAAVREAEERQRAAEEQEERQRAAEEQEERRRSVEEQEAYYARMAEDDKLFLDLEMEYYGTNGEGNGSPMENGYVNGIS